VNVLENRLRSEVEQRMDADALAATRAIEETECRRLVSLLSEAT